MLYKELDCVNERSGKPYKIAASVGIYITQNGEKPSFDELIRYSDKLMYEEKSVEKHLGQIKAKPHKSLKSSKKV